MSGSPVAAASPGGCAAACRSPVATRAGSRRRCAAAGPPGRRPGEPRHGSPGGVTVRLADRGQFPCAGPLPRVARQTLADHFGQAGRYPDEVRFRRLDPQDPPFFAWPGKWVCAAGQVCQDTTPGEDVHRRAWPARCAAVRVRPSHGCTLPFRHRRTAGLHTGRSRNRSRGRPRPGSAGSTVSHHNARRLVNPRRVGHAKRPPLDAALRPVHPEATGMRSPAPAGCRGGAPRARCSMAGRCEHGWPVGCGGTRQRGERFGSVPRMASGGPAGHGAVAMTVGGSAGMVMVVDAPRGTRGSCAGTDGAIC